MVRVGLIDVDSKIPNLALMKLSSYHKQIGDQVEWYAPLFSNVDIVYASKIFSFTEDYKYFPKCEVVKGGSDYALYTKLSLEIEFQRPDYSIYPNCDYALGFTTRGCIRNCKYCIVPKKEGPLTVVGDIYDFWNGQKFIKLLDNNLTADYAQFEKICKQLIKERVKVDFSQGLDIRLIDDDKAKLLSKVKRWKRIHFAFDNVKIEKQVRKGIKLLTKYIHPDQLTFYVLIGFDSTPEEDLYRVEVLRSLKVNPFVMPYNKRDNYQRKFARWANQKAIFKTVPWHEYKGA